jgi:ankyrin repeat protein
VIDFYTQYPGGKHFIQKLVLTDPVLDKTEIQRKKGGVVDGTCRWILKTKEYAMWLNGIAEPYTELQSRLLWLNGDPGRGKTYLACFVIDEISTFIKSSDGSLLIYFFCDANNEKRNTATSVLRGLILQLLRQCPRLFSYLSVQYEEQGEKLTSSFDALWTSFLKMVQDFGIKCTYCVIDGLDELNYHARSTILTAFTDAVEPSQHHEKAEAGGFLRVLMTSRPNPDIEEHLLPYASLSLRSEPASFIDIEIFIASKMKILKERKRYPPSTANFITEELKSKAEGTFLWVALTCEELNKVSSVEARKTIKNIPAGLPAVYRSILDQIKEENLSIVKRILGWVFVAFRPLLVEELHVACKVAEELGDGDDEIQFTIDCIGFCGSLVSIQSTESGDTVQLIHQSALQYLTKIVSPDDHLYVDIPKMHAEMGNRCLEKINEYFSPGPPSSKTFLDYAARYVMHHAREAGNIPDGFNVLNPFFDKESTVCRAWLQYQQKLEGFVDSRTLTGFSPLHIASRWGVISLAIHLLSGDEESCIELLSQRDGYDATPLYYAAEKSYFDIAQLFINRGADVHARGGDFDTILQAAAVGGHEGILKLLLDHNVKIDEAGGRYCCALQAAAVEGHGKIVNILLQAGADVNSPRGGLFNNPLQAAAAGGYLEIVKVLLEKGANVNLEGGRYVTALQAASAQGHATVVGYLLENKAYIHGDRDSNQWSPNSYPLSEFANNDSHHGTALHEAACRGHLQIVKILVQSGADIEAIDAYYGNSLHAAATGGNIRIVEFLAERIKDINLESGHYGFALQAAASLGHFEAVKLLVSNGADPNSVGGHYVTASKAAQRGGYIDIRNFLEELESRSR